jgi:hypothetical protein
MKTKHFAFIALIMIITISAFSCGGEKYSNEEQRNFDAIRREYTKKMMVQKIIL